MHNVGVLGLSVTRSEIDNFLQKDSKQTIIMMISSFCQNLIQFYLLTNWFAYLYWRIQSPRPDVTVGDYKGRGLCIRLYRYANQLVRSLLPD